MADLFQPGALVMLKSGGPLMTVTRYKEYTGYRSCECKWFNGPNVQVAEFRDVELRAHDEGPVLA